MCAEDTPDMSAAVRNLKQPMPLGRKLRLIARNNARKIIRGRSCCGNHGEPGC